MAGELPQWLLWVIDLIHRDMYLRERGLFRLYGPEVEPDVRIQFTLATPYAGLSEESSTLVRDIDFATEDRNKGPYLRGLVHGDKK